jgi:hypothetical protein
VSIFFNPVGAKRESWKEKTINFVERKNDFFFLFLFLGFFEGGVLQSRFPSFRIAMNFDNRFYRQVQYNGEVQFLFENGSRFEGSVEPLMRGKIFSNHNQEIFEIEQIIPSRERKKLYYEKYGKKMSKKQIFKAKSNCRGAGQLWMSADFLFKANGNFQIIDLEKLEE